MENKNNATTINNIDCSYNNNNLILNYKNHPSYILFISSLKSNYTKIKYDGCLQKYLKHYCNKNIVSISEVFSKDSKVIENEIIQQLIEMKKGKSSYSTRSVHIAALYHFFSINDITLNRKKLSKFVGEQENKYEYRSYTREEISRLLDLCDERGKVIVLLMASTGMRVGALPELKLKHLKRYKIDDNAHIYQIHVYATSRKYSYKAYCTPECAQAIDKYFEYRKRIS
jgi:integrase